MSNYLVSIVAKNNGDLPPKSSLVLMLGSMLS